MSRSIASCLIALIILVTWCVSAIYLDQSLLATQRSVQLLKLGAVNGDVLVNHQWWRLFVSQFLHVHFLHMLFNAISIFVVGALIEKVFGWRRLVIVYLVGGTLGQFASVIAYPTLVDSGASQALMALCGAAIILCQTRYARIIAIAIITVQIALDLHAVGGIKMGHSGGFGAGVAIGFIILAFKRNIRLKHAHTE